MKYSELYPILKQLFAQQSEEIAIPGSQIKIINPTFTSHHSDILPGTSDHIYSKHNCHFHNRYVPYKTELTEKQYHPSLHIPDSDILSNMVFRYTIFKPVTPQKSDGVILLFHGLNEKQWEKYLPWAYRLSESTGKAVILFPIAFHMNRAPAEWGDPRLMLDVSKQRQTKYPVMAQSSFANAAISSRIQILPQRLFWSGRQTYSDILQLVREIKNGELPFISPDASIDFFAYSIGAFLSEILIMTNSEGFFDHSKLFLFCGGTTLDRTYPVSRFILDSEANIALYAFFMEHLDRECQMDDRLNHYFNEDHRSGRYFRSMISIHRHRDLREGRFKEIGSKIQAVALQKDVVIPPVEVLNTLKGDYRDLPANVQILDFPFDYTHVNPFPLKNIKHSLVDDAFDQVFDSAANHLS